MIGKELLRMLKAAGLSRRALGRELGIANSTICRWINGDVEIGPVEAMGLAWYFESQHGIQSRWKWKAAA